MTREVPRAREKNAKRKKGSRVINYFSGKTLSFFFSSEENEEGILNFLWTSFFLYLVMPQCLYIIILINNHRAWECAVRKKNKVLLKVKFHSRKGKLLSMMRNFRIHNDFNGKFRKGCELILWKLIGKLVNERMFRH